MIPRECVKLLRASHGVLVRVMHVTVGGDVREVRHGSGQPSSTHDHGAPECSGCTAPAASATERAAGDATVVITRGPRSAEANRRAALRTRR